MSGSALASLPPPVNPGSPEGDYVAAFFAFFGNAYDAIANSFGAISFLAVAALAIWTLIEVRKGNKEWSDLWMILGVGGGVLVLVFFLLGEGTSIT